MNFSARLNSFKTKPELFFNEEDNINTVSLIRRMATVEGLTQIELNYPEHFKKNTLTEINEALENSHLTVSGIALRFSEIYDDGEFINPDDSIRNKAIKTTKEAIETCKKLGGNTTTIWLANDGFDYPFQIDYEKSWDKTVAALREIGEQYPEMNISFEYKPYQPRSFALVGDIGLTLLLLDDVNLPNFGVTLDFCHMLMKKENPAYALALAARKNRLMGFHLNDGYKDNDDGLMLGSVHLLQTIEFIYYAIKYNYEGLIYFDTFPIREDPVKECEMNIAMYKKLEQTIYNYGVENIEYLINTKDSTEIQKFSYSLLK